MDQVVYILGSSYSGSTLLGVLLGQHRACFNAGEIKALGRRDTDSEQCSCGAVLATCPFWSSLREQFEKTLSNPGWSNWARVAVALFRRRSATGDDDTAEARLIEGIARKAFGETQAGAVVDVSKSLWRLDRLRDSSALSVHVVWIRKTLPASISSLRKRGRYYWTALLQALITDWANRRYLKSQKIEYTEIWYEELATSTEATIADLLGSLGLKPSRSDDRRDALEMHLATGNEGTKLRVSSHGGIDVRLDHAWQTSLSDRQQKIACAAARRRGDPIDRYRLGQVASGQ